jgi:hypothetical protein
VGLFLNEKKWVISETQLPEIGVANDPLFLMIFILLIISIFVVLLISRFPRDNTSFISLFTFDY